VIAVIIGMPFGSVGIATAGTICVYLLFVPAIIYSGQPFGIGIPHLFRAIGPQLTGALAAMGFGMILRFMYLSEIPSLVRIIILVTACGTIYLLVTIVFFRLVEPLNVAKSFLFENMPAQVSRFVPKRFMPSTRN
jgi:PST family polysaccharide transporter